MVNSMWINHSLSIVVEFVGWMPHCPMVEWCLWRTPRWIVTMYRGWETIWPLTMWIVWICCIRWISTPLKINWSSPQNQVHWTSTTPATNSTSPKPTSSTISTTNPSNHPIKYGPTHSPPSLWWKSGRSIVVERMSIVLSPWVYLLALPSTLFHMGQLYSIHPIATCTTLPLTIPITWDQYLGYPPSQLNNLAPTMWMYSPCPAATPQSPNWNPNMGPYPMASHQSSSKSPTRIIACMWWLPHSASIGHCCLESSTCST